MIRVCSALCFWRLILLARPAQACQSLLALSTCNEVGASDLVFIGTVESREHPSAAALECLRDAYPKTFPELQADEKQQVRAAKTLSDITAFFYSSLSRGMRVRLHEGETARSPAAGVIVQLQSGQMARYPESDDNGRFVFDGLSEGDYNVSAYARGYPVEMHLLADPQPIHIAKKSCARQVLLLPKKEGN